MSVFPAIYIYNEGKPLISETRLQGLAQDPNRIFILPCPEPFLRLYTFPQNTGQAEVQAPADAGIPAPAVFSSAQVPSHLVL